MFIRRWSQISPRLSHSMDQYHTFMCSVSRFGEHDELCTKAWIWILAVNLICFQIAQLSMMKLTLATQPFELIEFLLYVYQLHHQHTSSHWHRWKKNFKKNEKIKSAFSWFMNINLSLIKIKMSQVVSVAIQCLQTSLFHLLSRLLKWCRDVNRLKKAIRMRKLISHLTPQLFGWIIDSLIYILIFNFRQL